MRSVALRSHVPCGFADHNNERLVERAADAGGLECTSDGRRWLFEADGEAELASTVLERLKRPDAGGVDEGDGIELDDDMSVVLGRSAQRVFDPVGMGEVELAVEAHGQDVVGVGSKLNCEVVVIAHPRSVADPGRTVILSVGRADQRRWRLAVGPPSTAVVVARTAVVRSWQASWFRTAGVGYVYRGRVLEGPVGPLRATVDLPASRRAPRLARRFVATTLAAWDLRSLHDDAQLVVSELVSNAVIHAPGPDSYRLELTQLGGSVRLSVADGSPRAPVMRTDDDGRPGGKGLRIIEALSAAWGHEPDHMGKRVWADLDG